MTTLNTMVKRVAGLAGTKDLTPWEQRFVEKVVEQIRQQHDVTHREADHLARGTARQTLRRVTRT